MIQVCVQVVQGIRLVYLARSNVSMPVVPFRTSIIDCSGKDAAEQTQS